MDGIPQPCYVMCFYHQISVLGCAPLLSSMQYLAHQLII